MEIYNKYMTTSYDDIEELVKHHKTKINTLMWQINKTPILKS